MISGEVLAQAKLGEQSSNPTLDAAGALIATQIDSIKLNFGFYISIFCVFSYLMPIMPAVHSFTYY